MLKKNSNYTTGNGTRDLPACSAATACRVTDAQHFTHFFFQVIASRNNITPTRDMASPFLMFLDHTQRHITVGRTPLDEWSARRRDLYLKIHKTCKRQISVLQAGFEPTISEHERPLGPAPLQYVTSLIRSISLRSSVFIKKLTWPNNCEDVDSTSLYVECQVDE